MKKTFLSFIAVYLFLSCFNILSGKELIMPVDSTFMPLAVGNKWVYLRRYAESHPDDYEEYSKVISYIPKDTVIGGKQYFYVIRFMGTWSDPCWMWYDKNKNRLHTYVNFIECKYQNLWFDYNLNVGGVVTGLCASGNTCEFNHDSIYFGIPSRLLKFSYHQSGYHYSWSTYNSFIKYFGPTKFEYYYSSATGSRSDVYDLTGCVINGVLYGDTSSVLTNINHIEPLGEYTLYQNYPNPFNSRTVISFQIPFDNFVTLKVYDLLGRELDVLVNENLNAGNHKTDFNPYNYGSGVYIYKLQAGDYTSVRKMILMK